MPTNSTLTGAGWLTVGAWIITSAVNPANLANIVTALIIFNKPDYVWHRWHTALLMWLFIVTPLVANIWFRRLLTPMESSGFIFHMVFFIASIVTLVVLGQRSSNEYVWQTIVDDLSGWTNPGVAFGIGCITVFLGPVGKTYYPDY
jgi:choline transport protein